MKNKTTQALTFSSARIHREIIAGIVAIEESHYERNVRRKAGFSRRERILLGPQRKEE